MRKDDDAKNAQLQLEVAVRKAQPGGIVEALKMAWDDSMSWQDELTSTDIARVCAMATICLTTPSRALLLIFAASDCGCYGNIHRQC